MKPRPHREIELREEYEADLTEFIGLLVAALEIPEVRQAVVERIAPHLTAPPKPVSKAPATGRTRRR